MTKRPTGDVCDPFEPVVHSIGSVTTFTERVPTDKPLKREFWIGFHCSAPGPSDEGDQPPVIKKGKTNG